MEINNIKNILRRNATIFETGGIKPTNSLGESWIGKVCWQLPGETQPTNASGYKLIPIATIFLNNLPFVPETLKGIQMINIFVDLEFFYNIGAEDYLPWFKIVTYDSLDNLVPCNYTSDEILAFPLTPRYVDDEFPTYDDLDEDLADKIYQMEQENDIEYYEDIYEDNHHIHKIGGYPSSIQNGIAFEEGYEFVMQISSDDKADFNIVDDGNFYFGYNPSTKQWSVKCDFY